MNRLAALLAQQRGCELHVLDHATSGPKPELVRELGATYHSNSFDGLRPDLVIQCTGATPVILEAIERVSSNGLVCLTGVSSGGNEVKLDVGKLNRTMVLENAVVFGTVNANRAHYEGAAAALARADRGWLRRVITRRVALDRWQDVLVRPPGDINVVLDFKL